MTEHAKGILFGNAFRFLPIGDRTEFFTAKCLSASRRIGAALVSTPDLFAPAKYLKENPSDAAYAALCRKTIFQASGEIVVFPVPPATEKMAVVDTVDVAESEIRCVTGILSPRGQIDGGE